jgi:hypothetical protein
MIGEGLSNNFYIPDQMVDAHKTIMEAQRHAPAGVHFHKFKTECNEKCFVTIIDIPADDE